MRATGLNAAWTDPKGAEANFDAFEAFAGVDVTVMVRPGITGLYSMEAKYHRLLDHFQQIAQLPPRHFVSAPFRYVDDDTFHLPYTPPAVSCWYDLDDVHTYRKAIDCPWDRVSDLQRGALVHRSFHNATVPFVLVPV